MCHISGDGGGSLSQSLFLSLKLTKSQSPILGQEGGVNLIPNFYAVHSCSGPKEHGPSGGASGDVLKSQGDAGANIPNPPCRFVTAHPKFPVRIPVVHIFP